MVDARHTVKYMTKYADFSRLLATVLTTSSDNSGHYGKVGQTMPRTVTSHTSHTSYSMARAQKLFVESQGGL